MTKKTTIILSIIGALAVLSGLAYYLQQQGLIKVFPTREDFAIKEMLTIDRNTFSAPEGLSPEKFEEAIQKLEQERQKVLDNPTSAPAWFNFGYTKGFLNDHEGAVVAWEKALELQPLNFVTAVNLANTYQYFIKDFAKAEEYYGKALEVKPDYTAAYEGLVDLYRYNLTEKQASLEPLLLEAIKIDAVNRVAYYSTLVDFFASEGNDMEKAQRYLTEVEKENKQAADQLRETYPAL